MQLHRARPEIEAAGADLAFIGQASPRHAAHFRRRFGLEVPLLADRERESYRAAGAKRATVGELLGPRSVAKGLRAAARSRTHQGRVIGDPAQLGGAMIIRPDGSIPWAHMAQDASDNAPPQRVVEAVRQAARG